MTERQERKTGKKDRKERNEIQTFSAIEAWRLCDGAVRCLLFPFRVFHNVPIREKSPMYQET